MAQYHRCRPSAEKRSTTSTRCADNALAPRLIPFWPFGTPQQHGRCVTIRLTAVSDGIPHDRHRARRFRRSQPSTPGQTCAGAKPFDTRDHVAREHRRSVMKPQSLAQGDDPTPAVILDDVSGGHLRPHREVLVHAIERVVHQVAMIACRSRACEVTNCCRGGDLHRGPATCFVRHGEVNRLAVEPETPSQGGRAKAGQYRPSGPGGTRFLR